MARAVIVLMGLLAPAMSAQAQEPLAVARELYASAAYEDALEALNKVERAPALAARIDEYRAFCFFALGRTAEATAAAENVYKADPLFEVESDASPRIAALFAAARRRVLPGVILDKYRSARQSLEKKDFAAAEAQFLVVKRLLEATGTADNDDPASDLRLVVDGFLDLVQVSKTDVKTAPASAAAPEPVPIPAAPATAAAATTTTAPPPAARPATSPASARRGEIYSSETPDVVPPVAVYQEMPTPPRDVVTDKKKRSGILAVLIDEKGYVERVDILKSFDPLYDNMVTSFALSWKYRPATKNGVPVRFQKMISLVN